MLYTITEETMSSYNADGKTVKALVATCKFTNKAIAICRQRKFENKQDWTARLMASV